MKKQKVKMYYTPQDIIDYIEGDRVAHPSAGSGGFLKQAADKLKDGKFDLIQNPHIPIKMKYKLLLALALLIILACGGTSAAGPTPTVQENAWYACTTFIERQLNLPSGDAQDYNPAGVTTLQAGQFQVDVYYAKEGNTYRCQITHRADGNWQLDGLLAR